MPDWIGGDGWSTAETYRHMATDQLHGVSASYERLCLAVAHRPDVCTLIDRMPLPKRQPNLLLAAVRYVDGPTDDPSAFCAFVLENLRTIETIMLERATQTNEPGRCASLLPQLAAIEGPLALLEVGASAGLCLYPDRYAYDYSGALLGSGTPRLRCELSDIAPPVRLPEVVWRAGLDLNPLDVSSDDDVRWLEALIWPEQTHRFTALAQAVARVGRELPCIVRGDLTRDLGELAAEAPPDATLVVFHSAVLAYLPEQARASFTASVRQIAARRPTAWLSNEGRGVLAGTGEVELRGAERFVVALDGVAVGATSPHGGQYRALR